MSISVNELRIGNWVEIMAAEDLPATINRVVGYDKDGSVLLEWYKNSENCLYCNQDQLQPIPLTEDVLLKCGFENVSKGYFVFGDYCMIQTYEWHLDYSDNSMRGDRAIAYPKYLHQLQNLIYFLTEEELVINF